MWNPEKESSQRAKAKVGEIAILAAFGDLLSRPEHVDECQEVNDAVDTALGNLDVVESSEPSRSYL